MEKLESCAGCRFWWLKYKDDEISVGECRKRAPLADITRSTAHWPSTDGDNWCGDFEPTGKAKDI